MSSFSRFATFQARPGHGQQLAEALLQAAAQVAEAPGCEHWLVHRDHTDPDRIRVSEIWSSRERCDAALAQAGEADRRRVMALVDGRPDVIDAEPLGGARALRGATGARAFAIPDAPDLSRDSALLGRYDLDDVSEARYVREHLGAVQVGLTHYRLPAGRRQGWAHRHGVAEEIYVGLSGGGRIRVDDELLALGPLVAVRVAPASTRELEAGPEGLEVLAFGSHSPGDGEMVADWWTA